MDFSKKSFTLIEVLIFTTLISLVFIGLSYLVTYSLYTTKINEHKILATHYAEELREWLRGEKESDWLTFVKDERMGVWCFNNNILSWTNHSSCSPSNLLDHLFKRTLVLSKPDDTQVRAEITVEWQEGNNIYKVPINTVFSVWE